MLIKFDYKKWLKNKDLKVVDKDNNPCYLYEYKNKHVVFLDKKVQDVEDAQIYFWVDDPSDHTAKNTPSTKLYWPKNRFEEWWYNLISKKY